MNFPIISNMSSIRKLLLGFIFISFTINTSWASSDAESIQLRYSLPGNETVEIHSAFGDLEQSSSVISDHDVENLVQHYRETQEPVILFDRVSDSELSRSPSSDKKSTLDPIREKLDKLEIPHETIPISDTEIKGLERAFASIKKTIKGSWIKPESHEIKLGTVMTLYRLGMSSYVWFAASSISTETALTLTIFQTSLTAIFNIMGRSTDKLFSARYLKGDYDASTKERFIRRQIFGLMIGELIVLGAVGADQIATVDAQARLLANSILLGTGDALLANVRHNAYSNNPKTYARLGFLGFTFLAPIALMDLIGVGGPVVLDAGFYQLKVSAIAMVGIYTGLIAAVKFMPKKVEAWLELPSKYLKPFRKFGQKLVSSKIITSCGRFLKKLKNTARSPSSYIQVEGRLAPISG